MYLMAGAIFFMLGVALTFLFYPYRILEVSNEPYPVEHQQILVGEVQHYTIVFCKSGNYVAKQTRVLLQTQTNEYINLDTSVIYSEEGCRESKLSVKIPSYVEPGTYKIVAYIDYQPNFLRTVAYKFETQEFDIIAN